MSYLFFPRAQEDILEQYRYYLAEEETGKIADRFLIAVEDAAAEISKRPNIGLLCSLESPVQEKLRSWPVRNFTAIRLYYFSSTDGIYIVRVLHSKRDVQRLLREK